MASAATASATSHIQLATERRIRVIVCAVSSWLFSMMTILPEDSGSFSATFPITATWSPSSITMGRRSRTTAPPSVWMNVVSSSSSRTSWRCVRVVVSTHTVCTRGRSRAARLPDRRPSVRDRPEPERVPAARVAVAPRSRPPRRRSRTACRPTSPRPVFGSRRSRSSPARPSRSLARREPCARRRRRALPRARAESPTPSTRAPQR